MLPTVHPRPRTHSQVLSGFDRALGLESTLRARGSGDDPTAGHTPMRREARTPGPAQAARVDLGVGAPSAEGRFTGTVEARPRSALLPPGGGDSEPQAESHPAALRGPWRLPAEWLHAPDTEAGRAARLAEIRQRHDAECPHCTTATAHRQTVFGEGAPSAEILFVGEAPGETEDEVGRPFVGRAGQKLNDMIHAMGLRREDVYIANVLKSRPPDNRTPLPHEVDACGPYLLAQIMAVAPRVIVTLGGPACKLLLNDSRGITRARGAWQTWTPPEGSDVPPVPVMPTYHPAYVLRNYTPKIRGEVWSDLKAVLERVGRTPPGSRQDGAAS
jgi:DNA polymerase